MFILRDLRGFALWNGHGRINFDEARLAPIVYGSGGTVGSSQPRRRRVVGPMRCRMFVLHDLHKFALWNGHVRIEMHEARLAPIF